MCRTYRGIDSNVSTYVGFSKKKVADSLIHGKWILICERILLKIKALCNIKFKKRVRMKNSDVTPIS